MSEVLVDGWKWIKTSWTFTFVFLLAAFWMIHCALISMPHPIFRIKRLFNFFFKFTFYCKDCLCLILKVNNNRNEIIRSSCPILMGKKPLLSKLRGSRLVALYSSHSCLVWHLFRKWCRVMLSKWRPQTLFQLINVLIDSAGDGIFKLLKSPGVDSASLCSWRAGTTTLFLLGS